jgi:hypothetical protein
VRAQHSWDVIVGQLTQTLESTVQGIDSRGLGGSDSRLLRADLA